jgi:hypothetical protein
MSGPALVDPRPFRFSGKEWSDVTVMGGDAARHFAETLVGMGLEFHHDPPVAAGTTVHRFLVAADPQKLAQLADLSLAPGAERVPET